MSILSSFLILNHQNGQLLNILFIVCSNSVGVDGLHIIFSDNGVSKLVNNLLYNSFCKSVIPLLDCVESSLYK